MVGKKPVSLGTKSAMSSFTAFADTAHYLYDHTSQWARASWPFTPHGSRQRFQSVESPAHRQGPRVHARLFAPQARRRPPELASEGQIDLLIATDRISQGQNLQDCDWPINYHIHWSRVACDARVVGRLLGACLTHVALGHRRVSPGGWSPPRLAGFAPGLSRGAEFDRSPTANHNAASFS